MRSPISRLVILLSLVALPAGGLLAVGSEAVDDADFSEQERAEMTPEQLAAEVYNDGLKHRDRAARNESKAATAEGEKQEKYQKRAMLEHERSVEDFEAALELSHNLYQAHSSLGYAYRKMGRFDESLAAYNKALHINPTYDEAIEYRAEAYLGLNRLDDAKQAYVRLFARNREYADTLMAAMQTWLELNGSEATAQAFATWIAERSEIAQQTASLDSDTTSSW